jgi:hypothetical protein
MIMTETQDQTKEQVIDQAWTDAYRISVPGAVNAAAVAATLGRNIAALTRHLGTREAARHPSLRCILGQLTYLMGTTLGPEFEEIDQLIENAKRLGIYDARLHQ